MITPASILAVIAKKTLGALIVANRAPADITTGDASVAPSRIVPFTPILRRPITESKNLRIEAKKG